MRLCLRSDWPETLWNCRVSFVSLSRDVYGIRCKKQKNLFLLEDSKFRFVRFVVYWLRNEAIFTFSSFTPSGKFVPQKFYFILIDKNFIMSLKGADPATTKTTLISPTVCRSRTSLCHLQRNLTTTSCSTAEKTRPFTNQRADQNTQDTIHQLCT